MTASRAEVCAWACAQAWRGDGELIASAMGMMPTIAVRLARATFEPDLVVSDGGARFVGGAWAVDEPAPGPVEAWAPYRSVFDYAARGTRHAMMGASQVDRYGQSNIANIGPFRQPTRQLLGVRGAPTNSINHATSYWVPKHSPRVFVPRVDVVSGVGFEPRDDLAESARRFVALRRVVTNLAVLDLCPQERLLRLRSVHPWSTVEDVVAATGFKLVIESDVETTPTPGDEALAVLRTVIDPRGLRDREVG
jgi:acyl CoA:acetate/3-ketoacid CoA transferase beta subunit